MESSDRQPSSSQAKFNRIGEWIKSLEVQPSCSYEHQPEFPSNPALKAPRFSPQTNPSPVTDLTFHFSHQNLEGTPRRRLSLNSSETVSETSTTTSDKQFSPSNDKNSDVDGNVQCTLDANSSSSSLACEAASSVMGSQETVLFEDEVRFTMGSSQLKKSNSTSHLGSECDGSRTKCDRLTDFSCLVSSAESSSVQLSGNGRIRLLSECASSGLATWSDIQSPTYSAISPAPSSVFTYNDEEVSKDSAIFSENSNSRCSDFAIPSGSRIPRSRQEKLSSSVSSRSTLSRKFSDDDGFCEELMESVMECVQEESENVMPLGDKMENDVNSAKNVDWTTLFSGKLLNRPSKSSISEKLARKTSIVRRKKSTVSTASEPSISSSGQETTPGRIRRLRAPLKDIGNSQEKVSGKFGRKTGVDAGRSGQGLKRCATMHQTTLCGQWGGSGQCQVKRKKSVVEIPRDLENVDTLSLKCLGLSRCLSETEVTCPNVAHPDHNHYDNQELVGDFSRGHFLPLLERPKISDLKCIGPDTLADLLRNRYSHKIEDYQIIDCRFPYEFEGGHVMGAENSFGHEEKAVATAVDMFFMKEALAEKSVINKKKVLIFYCEFSAKRGPTLARLVRARDRKMNQYPHLHYPEIYLLDSGYKKFYSCYKSLCVPPKYVRMNDQKENILHFRRKAKTWTGDCGAAGPETSYRRPGLQRGLFV